MSKGTEYRITGCRDCPFLNEETEGDGPFCSHPNSDKALVIETKPTETGLISHWNGNFVPDNYFPVTPEWCPLKKQSVMITLLQKDETGEYNYFKKAEDVNFNIP
jgi:hypothetical protein